MSNTEMHRETHSESGTQIQIIKGRKYIQVCKMYTNV